MGQHSSPGAHRRSPLVGLPKHMGARAVIALVAVIVLAWGAVAVLKLDAVQLAEAAPCARPTTLSVMTASSFAPVLKEVAPGLAREKDCLRLDIKVVDGRGASDRLATDDTDVWIPDDAAWAMRSGHDVLTPDVLAQRGRGGAHTVLATSPIYQVTDAATAARISDAGGTWLALSRLLAASSGVRLAVRAPDSSGDGMVALGALSEAVWLDKGMDSATVASVASRRVSRAPAGSAPALPSEPGEVALVPEYALIPLLNSAAARLSILTGADRTAALRFTWLPLSAALADPDRKAGMDKLLAALTSKSADRAVAKAGLRRPDGGPPAGTPGGRLPKLSAKPFDVIAPHHVDHIFAAWYPQERRANLLFVVDVSGSMGDPAPGSGAPVIRLVAAGCESVGALLPPDSRIGVWAFGSRLDPPRDYRVLLKSAPLTSAHRRSLSIVVGRLAAQRTGTGLYDTILAAYRSAVAGYTEGMPNQVLVFTDAVNEDDPGGLTLGQLSAQLKAAANPKRPVSVAVAAFGSQPPNGGLKAALKPINGSVVKVASAQQLGAVFVHAAVGGLR